MPKSPSDIHQSVILFSALNWGFGHVTRSISIIDQLLLRKNRIIICGSEAQLAVYNQYFDKNDNIHFEQLDGYPFKFRGSGYFEFDMIKNAIPLYKFFKYEKKWVSRKVAEFNADYVISDHRYGFYSTKKHSIFITHQYQLHTNQLFNSLHRLFFKSFNSIWLIDDNQHSNAGKLSNTLEDKRAVYIGLQTRFLRYNNKNTHDTQESILIVNGPSSYWPNLIKLYLKQINNGDITVIIGNPSVKQFIPLDFKGQFIQNENWLEVDMMILKAKNIYSYMGYSTLMDLKFLGISIENLLPCKGQKEQEYLFEWHKKSPIK